MIATASYARARRHVLRMLTSIRSDPVLFLVLFLSVLIAFVLPYFEFRNFTSGGISYMIPGVPLGDGHESKVLVGQYENLYAKVGAILSFITILLIILQDSRQHNDQRKQEAYQLYFSLIQTYIKTKNSYVIRKSSGVFYTVGQRIFTTIYKNFRNALKQYVSNNDKIVVRGHSVGRVMVTNASYAILDGSPEEIAVFAFTRDAWQDILNSHFRFMYHIVNSVDSDDALDDSGKRKLIKILRALIVPHEHILLYYNGLALPDEKFKKLIEKYGLLHEMPPQWIVRSSLLNPGYREYAQSAYGDSQHPPGLINYGDL